MKRTILAILFAVSLLSISACKGKKTGEAVDSTAVQTTQPQTTAPADTTAAMDTTAVK
jgi:hypothetical protein